MESGLSFELQKPEKCFSDPQIMFIPSYIIINNVVYNLASQSTKSSYKHSQLMMEKLEFQKKKIIYIEFWGNLCER
jgi:hypothetical protein